MHRFAFYRRVPGKRGEKSCRQTERPLRQEQGLYKNTTVVRGPIFEKYPLGGLLGGQKTRFLTKNGGGTKRSNFDPFFWTPKNVIFSTFFDFFGFFAKKKTIQKKYRLKKKAKKRKNRSHLSDRAKIKNVPFKEMKTTRQKTSKNNDFPGDTTQKNDKIQNRVKNVKKHEKTREIEIQYIYI